MARAYTEEVVVRIWRNVKTLGGRLPTSHFGHAALTIRGKRLARLVPGGRVEISFWPGAGAGIGLSGIRSTTAKFGDYQSDKVDEMNKMTGIRLEVGYRRAHGIPYPPEWDEVLRLLHKEAIDTPRPGQRPTGANLDMDGLPIPLWSQSAENKINLPGLRAEGTLWGLSIRRMSEWWDDFKKTGPQYRALSYNNCAGIVFEALKAGGSEAFLEAPRVVVYAEPVQVEQYALNLQVQLQRFNDWTRELDDEIRDAVVNGRIGSKPSENLIDGLWTLDEWKRQSALGGFTIRSSTIRKIDDAVADYHRHDVKTAFEKKLIAMANIIKGISKHRQEKPDSKRSEAILRLGHQVIALLR
ncbi:MAG: hypothetical protein QM736_26355 [Vicinamibacterales bacterium]